MAIVNYIHMFIDFIIDFFFGLYYKNKRENIPPATNQILLTSATQLARKIRQGELKSEEVVSAFIARIKEVNGVINAVVDDRFEDALEEARMVDKRIKGGVITKADFEEMPFLGLPFTSKESTLCKGMRSSFGLVPRKEVRAEEDAEIIQNMKKCGGILLGVTNVPQLNLWTETHNPVYGLTKNPYNTTRNVGGSSGGEAAIIAACGSPFGVGTDIGGSIRIPAYMCGLFGHKCTAQLTKTKGLTYRDGSEADSTMVVTGPIVRYAEDIIPGVKVLLGSSHKELNLDENVDVTKLKYYFIHENGDMYCSAITSEVRGAMQKVVDYFTQIANPEEIKLDGLQYTTKIYRYWLSQEKGSNFANDITARTSNTRGEQTVNRHHPDDGWHSGGVHQVNGRNQNTAGAFTEFFKYIFGKSELTFSAIMGLMNNQILPEVSGVWAQQITSMLRCELLDKLGEDGVLLYPSWPTTAGYHHSGYFRPFNFSYMNVFNVLKLPATQVPLGLSNEGLPLGIQVAAGPYKDHLCIAVAKELEKVFGGYVPPFNTTS